MSEQEQDYKPSRIFTLEEANAMLPLVSAIASDLARLSRDVIDRRQRLAYVAQNRELSTGDPYDDEIALVERELDQDSQQLREYVEELRELGVEPKGAAEGLVDFPTMLDGRLAYLCWKVGEPEVLFWHELDAGFAGRQPLAAVTVADDASGSTRFFEN
ncbi:MAG: DUF2203 domain-containing protein [Pirellulaceae bacterium]|nr:DUF2203 domain-containing protein [Pirellulaceae bacterium]